MTDLAPTPKVAAPPRQAMATCHACLDGLLHRLARVAAAASPAALPADAAEVVLAFDYALGVHLADEEEDVFPAVLAAAQSPARHAQAFELVSSLLVEHREMTEAWSALRVALGAATKGLDAPLPAAEAARFLALCSRHMEREERELGDLLGVVRGERLDSLAHAIAIRHERCERDCPIGDLPGKGRPGC